MADFQFGQFGDIRADAQAVGGDAQEHVGIALADQTQRFHRLLRIGEGVARARNAHHGDRLFHIDELRYIVGRLAR